MYPEIISATPETDIKESKLLVVSLSTGLSVREFDISKKTKQQADSLGDAILNELDHNFYIHYEK